ncbi:30S ribosomal protein S20 [Mycoplasma sp. SG1]|uniref:30S ribosomal protein S20 n=1 Tax=Mycoplasma sp. SG1 TaxID=2810348 RepID=UPI0020256410|nr:30S ribosomal protein S20 [Mycoplasma sp. SG1]URM53092.1 30S ribosomal protein S20 [Mycoplasma sp. SG1]
MKPINKKRKRKELAKKIQNKAKINQIKTYIKKYNLSVNPQNRDLKASEDLFLLIQKKVDKASKTNVIHQNKANKIKSKLIKKINDLKKTDTQKIST